MSLPSKSGMRSIAAIGLLWVGALIAPAHATSTPPPAPDVDSSALAALADLAGDLNPYRGDLRAIAVGRDAFNQSCARCHGVDADAHASPAPDLRRIGRICARVPEPDLQLRCQTDADAYFRDTVEKGKIKLGIEHMPPWKNVLSTELIWAIRSFVETSQGRAK
ncbi:c-type cytochrome [Zoogloeaceae bacterium G21618-S1]|nr:c-type cytochrome [Zoogloeaceae bacterium G21618-S1]